MSAPRRPASAEPAHRRIAPEDLAALVAAAARLQAGLADLHDALARLRDPDRTPAEARWPSDPDLSRVGAAPKAAARRSRR